MNGAGNVSDSHIVFVSNRFTKASTSCAFQAAKLSRAMCRLSCPAMVSPPNSCEVMQFRFRLVQPKAHIHLAVHRRRGREVLLCSVALTGAPVELAEAEVAV